MVSWIVAFALTQVPDDDRSLYDAFQFRYDLSCPPRGDWPSGDYFGDGGGGKYTKFPTLRRCGVGVASVVDRFFRFGVHAPLPGEIQTVPRSEVAAALILLFHLASDTAVNFYYDNQICFDAYNKGYQHCCTILNNELYT